MEGKLLVRSQFDWIYLFDLSGLVLSNISIQSDWLSVDPDSQLYQIENLKYKILEALKYKINLSGTQNLFYCREVAK